MKVNVCVCVCVCVYVCSLLSDSATRWTEACQVPLFTEFSRQEDWSRLPFPAPEDLPDSEIEHECLVSPALAGRFFITCATYLTMDLEKQWHPTKCCREKLILTPCRSCFFDLLFVAFVIIITYNGLPQIILSLCLTVQVPVFRLLSTCRWQEGRN